MFVSKTEPANLTACCVLVVEDEYLIAEEVAFTLGRVGAQVLGPVPDVSNGLDLLAAGDRIDVALLDVELRGELVWPLADALLANGVPIVLSTSGNMDTIPQTYSGLARCDKLITDFGLVRTLAAAINASFNRCCL